MSLPRLSIRRPVTTLMVSVGVVLMGVIAWTRLAQELYPPITYPQLTVVTSYKDAAPEEIEILVTKPIEEMVGTVPGLRRVNSVSKEEVSLVIAEFNWGTHMDFAGLGVREKLDLIKERLPRGAEEPIVIKLNPFELPVLVINISGEFDPHELLEISRKQIKREIEKVDGVAVVNVTGGLEREILVEVDQARLQAASMPISQVVEALSKANINYPAGTIKEAFYEYLIRTMGEFQVVPEIPKIAVGLEAQKGPAEGREPAEEPDRQGPLKREKGLAPPQRVILLKDIATVKDTFKERSSISRFNGRENVSLNIQKQAGANTIQVSREVREVIRRIQPSLPRGLELTVVNDQAAFIRSSIAGVRDAAIQGGGLAFLVLFLFLGNPWAALNVSFAIPISVLATIALMYFTGISINVISMGGLALGIGFLVDGGICVVENIDRYRGRQLSAAEAAVQGTEEVQSAVVGSNLTNVVVFLPMVFVAGIVGQLLKDLAYTVTFSQLIGVVVSLTLTALIASRIKRGAGRSPIDPVVVRLQRFDAKAARWFIQNRVVGIGLVLVLFALAVVTIGKLDREVLPRADQGQFTLRVTLPPGSRLEVTDRIARKIERVLHATPEVKSVTVAIGSPKEKKAEELLETLGSHQANIFVTLKPKHRGWRPPPDGSEFRTRKSSEVVEELKDTFARETLEGAEIDYLLEDSALKSSFLVSAPIVVEVKGQEILPLERLAGEVKSLLEQVPGLYGAQTSSVPPSPETKVHVMKDRAAAYQLSVSDIALTAQTAVKGVIATKLKEEGKEYDIRVRLRKQDRVDLNKVRRLLVHSPLEVDVPLEEVATFSVGKGPTEVRHLDQQRTVLVSAQLARRPLAQVLREIEASLKRMRAPAGYTVSLTGENEQMKESFRSLLFALALAILLVYMVMACEFESLWQPFLIMATIPMALIGVALGLWITQTPISVMVAIGFILLGGIVVANGIVLIEHVNTLRAQGMGAEEAVIQASQVRLRPILMTASAQILGLLPLALKLQEGVELQAPMAITQIWGMMISTFLTLIFLPTIYVVGANFFERLPWFKPEVEISRPGGLEMTDHAANVISNKVRNLAPPVAPEPPPELLQTGELPEIPEGFGGEDAVQEKGEGPILFPGSSIGVPEPPEEPSTVRPSTSSGRTEEPLPKPEPPQPPSLPPLPSITPPPMPPIGPPAGSAPAPLNPRQERLLLHLKQHGRITRKEFVEMTSASVPTAARDLQELVARGLIEGVGPLARGRYYVLVNR